MLRGLMCWVAECVESLNVLEVECVERLNVF